MSKVLSLAICVTAVFSAAAADDLSIAKEALRDGLWEIARTHAGTNDSEEARLVVLESLAGEGKWDEIGKRLMGWKDAKGDGFDYYRAVVKGDHAEAMGILKRSGSSEGLVEAQLFEAETLAKDGKRDQANGIWREIVTSTNVGMRVFAIASANLMDAALLRRAYAEVKDLSLRRTTGLRLGGSLLRDPKTAEEGKTLIRSIVKDAPDARGAREAFLAIADSEIAAANWTAAADVYHEAIETWPDVAKTASVQEGRGWVLDKLGKKDEAIEAFRLSGTLAKDDEARAVALVKEGDVLQELGRSDEAMSRYRLALEKYPDAQVSRTLKSVVRIRELEAKGRDLYRAFKFEEAQAAFAEVGKADPSRRARMDFFSALCLYGQGQDDKAEAGIRRLVESCSDTVVRREAMLWLAKFLYNRREWKASGRLFVEFAAQQGDSEPAAEALLWASRAAFADGKYNQAIKLSTEIAERYPNAKVKGRALMVQGESLIELARFDEAVLVFDRIAVSDDVPQDDRIHAKMLRADAFYAMGADNASRYVTALEAYQDIRFSGNLSASERLLVSYRIARSLDKLKRTEEAMDQYYAQVVLAYREARTAGTYFTDEARAVFSKAAFRLADEYESRGQERPALGVLELVAESDVPAAGEAARRIDKMRRKGRFL